MILDPDRYRANLLKYTSLAFELLPRLKEPRILDVGCGTGVPTIHLAELSGGTLVAIDTDRVALAQLADRPELKGLSDRVRLVTAPIENMPFDKESFDVVWAGGSIAQLGFGTALKLLGSYLKTGGFLVMHDDAGDCLHKISMVPDSGCLLLGFFLLSDDIWWREYYMYLEKGLATAESVCPPHRLADIKKELEQFRIEPKDFQSAFFVMKKTRAFLAGLNSQDATVQERVETGRSLKPGRPSS